MDSSINLRVNAGQAKSEAESVKQSLDEITASFEKLKNAGDWSGAADVARKMQESAAQITRMAAGAGGSGGSNGIFAGIAAGGSQAQSVRVLEMRLETLARVGEELTEQLEKAAENGDYRGTFNLSAALNNVDQERRSLAAEKMRLENQGKDDREQRRDDAFSVFNLSRMLGYAISGATISSNYRQAIANGDYLGAGIQAKGAVGDMAMGIGGSMMTAGMMTGFIPLTALGGAATLVGGILKIFSSEESADKAEGEAFERSLQATHGLNRLFSDGQGYDENNNNAAALILEGERYAQDTGLPIYEILQLASQQAAFGSASYTDALEQARQAALFSQSTGANVGSAQNLLGLARRFGDSSDVLDLVSRARESSGMTKAQTDEFLTSLSRVVEEGIASGYIRSTKDVAATMTMFARLTENDPLWQGKYGEQRLSQMNRGLAGAVDLQSTSDVIAYNAAQAVLDSAKPERAARLLGGITPTGTYHDEMMLLENGLSPEMFTEVAERVFSMEGENRAARIEWFKQIYGLNTSGAVKVDEMADKALKGGADIDELKKQLESIRGNAQYQSYETQRQNLINKLDGSVALLGRNEFEEMMKKLLGLADKKDGERETQENREKSNAIAEDFANGIREGAYDGSDPNALMIFANEAGNYDEALRQALLTTTIQNEASNSNDVGIGSFFNIFIGEATPGDQQTMKDFALNAARDAMVNYSASGKPDGITIEEVLKLMRAVKSDEDIKNAYNLAFEDKNVEIFKQAFTEAIKSALNGAVLETTAG